jgi:2-polyprenyl-3-methyl-5-hydroxy-6-metoxy-1,4-benzoquinol methylase
MDTTFRSNAPEMMDDFAMEGEVLKDALDKIAKINQLLGGNKVTLQGLTQLLKYSSTKTIRILDVGCGNGDLLRTLAKYAQQHHYNFQLHGIDANAFTIKYAESLSIKYPNITYHCTDILKEPVIKDQYDIILCTLTLHHFKNDEIIKLLANFSKQCKLGFVINDLHRNAIAYYLFYALCFLFRLNDMSREDGLVSILRGFKRADFKLYSKQLHFKNEILKWKWAFRYQWIVKTYG